MITAQNVTNLGRERAAKISPLDHQRVQPSLLVP